MGYLEATVVLYLRAALDASLGSGPPQVEAFTRFSTVEVVRELATLVMIAAVAWLAGTNGWERLAWAAVIFGAWDITYYAGLWLIAGWPPTLVTWDVLFLVPRPWVGPVWAPMLVSAVLVGFGLAGARWARAAVHPAVSRLGVAVAVTGGALVVVSFLVDSDGVLAGTTDQWGGWPIYWLGLILASLAALLTITRRGVSQARAGP